MPANQQFEAGELRRQIENLALECVLGQRLDAPEALRALSETLARIRDHAAGAGWGEVAEIASKLADPVSEAAGGGGADLAALEQALRKGVSELQQAVERRSAGESRQKDLSQDTELLNDVILESREHLATVENRLLTLERDPGNSEAIHSVFRSFHTIKGLAGFLELTAIAEVSHEVETVLDLARNGKLAVTPAVIDLVLESKDYLSEAIERLEASLHGGAREPAPDNTPLLERIRALLDEAATVEAPARGPEAPAAEAADGSAEAAPAAAARSVAKQVQAAGDAALESKLQAAKRSLAEARAIKVDTAKLDFLVDMAGEMVIAQSLVQHDPDLARLESPRLQRSLSQLARITAEIQKTAMAMRMVPIGQLFRRMIRLVRDLSRQAGKKVELAISGEDTELDRTIVEALGDPLVHMVRNSIDHGIERPEERLAAGKPEAGRISLRAYHHAGHIVIEISDNGRGLAKEKILARARERGLISEGAVLTDTEIHNLIFEPGFSTAERVTGISGRGVGMDVVRKHIQKLRGRIDIQTEAGRGTTFSLKLPLTLAIIDGLVVGVGRERYVVPIFTVREMFRPAREMVSALPSGDETVLVRDHLLPVMRLHRRFGVKPRSEDPCECLFIVAECEGKAFCLMVDEFVGKQEVVIKSLGETLKNIPGIAGAAILGDGRVGLVLDMDGVFDQNADV